MKKTLNLCLLFAFLLTYLEWGSNQHVFIFEAELEILSRAFSNASSVVHPFTLIPFAGQLVLLFTLFQKIPSKKLTYLGMACLASLVVFILLVGILSLNLKIIASTLPFLLVSCFIIIVNRKKAG